LAAYLPLHLMLSAPEPEATSLNLHRFDMIYGGNGKSKWTPVRNAIGHTHGRAESFKRTCVRSNDILACNILSENAHRTLGFPSRMVARGCWLLEREEHRALDFHPHRKGGWSWSVLRSTNTLHRRTRCWLGVATTLVCASVASEASASH
jgi:hypothetical protein